MNSLAKPPAATSSTFTAPSEPQDEIFLEGARSRFAEFFTLLRVMRDFLRGFCTLHFVGPCVTDFWLGPDQTRRSALRANQKNGGSIARLGFTVITGGGPGIMEAANRGARKLAAVLLAALSNYRRATDERLSRSLRADALFLRPQDAAGKVFLRLCRHARRRRHARRAVRGGYPDPNGEGQKFSNCDNGNRLLERTALSSTKWRSEE